MNKADETEEAIFSAAQLLKDSAKRHAYLDLACDGDPDLRRRMERLLASASGAEDFFKRSAAVVPQVTIPPDTSFVNPISEGPNSVIGRYKLLEKIGEGGMGVVYMAEQEQPVRRKVALKIIKLGMDTRQVVARFEAERQALALMDHPNIAKVLDGGATESGRPFFVMELVQGVPITRFCDENLLSTEDRLKLFVPVCQAIQSAHQKGIIHRDIKPSNVMVTLNDGVPHPMVIDFGVAKATNQKLTEKTLFTNFATMIGTPAYMSPEQAEMSKLDVDTRSDIYSLGVLLYELLAGTTPFPEKRLRSVAYREMQRIIVEEEPERPSKVVERSSKLRVERGEALPPPGSSTLNSQLQSLSTDLDWIVMKCLEKDRTRRYETANGLAADLQRYLNNEPITARPPSNLYRFQKLARRNKLLFGAAGAVAAALVAGVLIASWQAVRARQAEEATRRRAYAAEINAAQQALTENNLERALELLDRQKPKVGEEDLRGFEWRYLWQLCQSDAATTFRDNRARAIAFSKDGRWLAYGGAGQVIVREAASHRVITNLLTSVSTLSFSPDGTLLATAGKAEVKLWDTRTWREAPHPLPGAEAAAFFSPDGAWLVTGQTNGERLLLWSTANWKRVADCLGTPDVRLYLPNGIAFSPDGKLLVTPWFKLVDEKAGLRLWKLPSLEPYGELFPAKMPLASAAFLPDSRHLLTGTYDGRLLVWDIAGSEPRIVQDFHEHSTHITWIAVPSGGNVFATAGEDQTVNLWDVSTRQHEARLRGHTGQINALAISPDGRTVASGCWDGTTRLWNADRTNATDLLNVGSLIAGFTADSRTLVLGPREGDSRWHLTGRATPPIPVATNSPFADDFLNQPFDVQGDQPLGVLGRANGWLELWNLAAGTQIATWLAETNEIKIATFSPDGGHVATGSATGRIKIWNLATHEAVVAFDTTNQPVTALAYSPDGRTLAGACGSSPVFLWDVAGRREVRRVPYQIGIFCLGISPDGHLLAVGNLLGGVDAFEIPSGRLRAELKGHVMGVLRAGFFPDGKTLATGGLDGKVKLWNLATHQEVITLSLPLGGTFRSLCISPDGRSVAVGYMGFPGHHVRMFRAPSFEEIAAAEKDRP